MCVSDVKRYELCVLVLLSPGGSAGNDDVSEMTYGLRDPCANNRLGGDHRFYAQSIADIFTSIRENGKQTIIPVLY